MHRVVVFVSFYHFFCYHLPDRHLKNVELMLQGSGFRRLKRRPQIDIFTLVMISAKRFHAAVDRTVLVNTTIDRRENTRKLKDASWSSDHHVHF